MVSGLGKSEIFVALTMVESMPNAVNVAQRPRRRQHSTRTRRREGRWCKDIAAEKGRVATELGSTIIKRRGISLAL